MVSIAGRVAVPIGVVAVVVAHVNEPKVISRKPWRSAARKHCPGRPVWQSSPSKSAPSWLPPGSATAATTFPVTLSIWKNACSHGGPDPGWQSIGAAEVGPGVQAAATAAIPRHASTSWGHTPEVPILVFPRLIRKLYRQEHV